MNEKKAVVAAPWTKKTMSKNFAWNSGLRKLRDPFVYNDETRAAAKGTLKGSRGGWPPFPGLRGGAPPVHLEARASCLRIMGRFNDDNSELLVSKHGDELTIVRRNNVNNNFILNRVNLVDDSGTNSSGENVELGEFVNEDVFKRYYLRAGKDQNEIEVEEFRINRPELRATHSSKLMGALLLKFILDNGIEKLQVIMV